MQKKVTISNSVDACRHFMLAVADGAALCTGLACYLIKPLDVRRHAFSRADLAKIDVWRTGAELPCPARPRTVETGHNWLFGDSGGRAGRYTRHAVATTGISL